MKAEKKLLYKLLKINDKDIVKIDGGTYQVDGFILKHIKGNANYHDKHLMLLFDREETIEKVTTVTCDQNCNECPIRLLECLDKDGDQPVGISLYEILNTLVSAYEESEDVKEFFKGKIDEHLKKKCSKDYLRNNE